MPNIELHGYAPQEAIDIRNKIREALKPSKDADEIVITIIPSDVEDLKGNKMPFLRVYLGPRPADDLKKYLEPLGEDIEVLVLDRWIPKKKLH